MNNFKPSKTQQKIIDQIAAKGYIQERDLAKPTRAVLWNAGIIYFDTIMIKSRPDSRGMVWDISEDACLLTENGKTFVSVGKAQEGRE